MNVHTMDLGKVKEQVLHSTDIDELRKIQLDLTEYKGNLHKSILMSDSPSEKTEIIASLNLSSSMLNIVLDRLEELKSEQNRVNYNFRMAAKEILTKEMYNNIFELAKKTRYEAKPILHKLKHDKK
jgi:predicted nuclease with TOPRIM domain